MNDASPMARPVPTPKLPVFGWRALGGAARADQPCLLDLPGCTLTTSGRASILLALEALSVRAGDAVLLPTYHCPTMVAPADAIGAVPRFYAITERGGPDLAALERQPTDGVRAMLVPHLFGLPQPMAQIRRWCDQRGIALIEDCAHAMFGSSDGRPVGSWGDAAIGSLTKFLPVPEGGCLVLQPRYTAPALQARTARAELKAWLDIVEDGARHGRLTGLNSLITAPLDLLRSLRARHTAAGHGDDHSGKPFQIESDFVIDGAQARSQITRACGNLAVHMPRARVVQHRRSHYRQLAQALSGVPGLRPLLPDLPDDAVPYVFPIWVEQPDPGYQALRSKRIPVFRWDRLWPTTSTLPGDHGVMWSHHVIQLPCHQDLRPVDLNAIVAAVKSAYRRLP